MINGENFFDQPIKNDKVTYENIRKIATGQGDDYTTGCLLNYSYFIDTYKMIAVDLSKQQALDADPRAIQQINFIANLQSVTKIVRLAPPPPLYNVGCKFVYSFLVLTVWHGFFRLSTTLSQGGGGILGNFNQA